ncbi:MAG TPA: tetratricopeptide repeat protein, partial [Burkholderiaceae bacterium]
MDFEYQWLLLGLPLFFILGWLGSRFDLRQMRRETRESPKAYYKGLSLLLNEQQDKAIDAFIETVQNDPDTTELHFALGNLFRRRGEFERSVRVHQHLLVRADLPQAERERAQHALAQDFVKAGLFDRAEAAYKALEGTAYHTEARLALLNLYERSRDWRAAIDTAQQLETAGTGSFARRISHYWCELAQVAEDQHHPDEAERALQQALKADPSSARPLVMQGQRLARAGQPAQAFEAWSELRRRDPAAFTLVAGDYAAAAIAAGRGADAKATLEKLLADAPRLDFLAAWAR